MSLEFRVLQPQEFYQKHVEAGVRYQFDVGSTEYRAAVFRIRIDFNRIRIQLFKWIGIRIQLFKWIEIRIQL
jgi:hypothetical protein